MIRPAIYAATVVGVAAAAGFAVTRPPAATGDSEVNPAVIVQDTQTIGLPTNLGGRPNVPDKPGDLFATPARDPDPVTAKPPVLATPAVAPPMPYRFAGVITQGGSAQHVLSKGERIFVVKQGDVLDGAYRVEALGKEEITLVYLPLDLRTSLSASSPLIGVQPARQATGAHPDGALASRPMPADQSQPEVAPTARAIHSRDPRSLFRRP